MADDERPYALVAIPDSAVSAIFYVALSKRGIEPVIVRDGSVASSLLVERGAPRLLATDLSLTGRDGFEVLKDLARLGPGADTPAIVVSAFPELMAAAWRRRAELGVWSILPPHAGADAFDHAIERALAGERDLEPELSLEAEPEPEEEERRLETVRKLDLVSDGAQDETLERIVRETAAQFDVPIALITLILSDRQWFKAHVGLEGRMLADRGTPIDQAFCRHVVASGQPLIVPDARRHPSFSDNALVTSGIVGSYAGVPLATSDGQVFGTLCIIDRKPLGISSQDVDHLQALARRVAGEIHLRSIPASAQPPLEWEYARAVLEHIDVGVLLLDHRRHVVYANAALLGMTGLSREHVLAMSLDEWIDAAAQLVDDPLDFKVRLRVLPTGPFAAREELRLARPRGRVVRWVASPIALREGVGQLILHTDITAEHERLRHTLG